MNKRQAKKREKLEQLGIDWGFYRLPKYKEIKYVERGYHEYCLQHYRTKRNGKSLKKGMLF